jgi:hypothetical protein
VTKIILHTLCGLFKLRGLLKASDDLHKPLELMANALIALYSPQQVSYPYDTPHLSSSVTSLNRHHQLNLEGSPRRSAHLTRSLKARHAPRDDGERVPLRAERVC